MAEGEERWTEGGVGEAWVICNSCGHAWNDDGRDYCFGCGHTYEQSHAWRVVRASRFEEVQVELAVWKKQSAAQVELAEMDVERAEAERDQAKEAEARSFANSANATAALVRAEADLERPEAEMTLSEDEALALFAWFDHVGRPYVPAMSAFRRDLDVVEAKIRAFLALAEARERGEDG